MATDKENEEARIRGAGLAVSYAKKVTIDSNKLLKLAKDLAEFIHPGSTAE